jgi:hypothetical protein
MGIRFLCPNGHKLHVKSHLAGRKGVCPTCGAKVLIPQEPLPTTDSAESPEPRTKALAAEAPAAPPGWFVRGADGEQYGPAPEELLNDWIADGRIASETWVWREGWPEWQQAGAALADRFPELAAAASPMPALPEVEPVGPPLAEPDWPAEDPGDSAPDLGGFAIDVERSDTIARLRKTHPRRRLKSNTVWAVLLLSTLSVALCGLLVWILAFRS